MKLTLLGILTGVLLFFSHPGVAQIDSSLLKPVAKDTGKSPVSIGGYVESEPGLGRGSTGTTHRVVCGMGSPVARPEADEGHRFGDDGGNAPERRRFDLGIVSTIVSCACLGDCDRS